MSTLNDRRPVLAVAALAAAGLFLLLCCSEIGAGWDVTYDADSMPQDAGWSLYAVGVPGSSAECAARDGVLSLLDSRTDSTTLFLKEDPALATSETLTVEARVRVVSAANFADLDAVSLGGSIGYGGSVRLWPDRIATLYRGDNVFRVHSVDMTVFHVIRLAIDKRPFVPTLRVWLDGTQVFAGPAPGVLPRGIFFGTSLIADATSESYWDYVRYSNEYLPVPEPSGLLALAGGMSGLLALSRRRRAQACAPPGRRLQ